MSILGVLPESKHSELLRGLTAQRLSPQSPSAVHQQSGIAAAVCDFSSLAHLGESFLLLDARIDNLRELAAALDLDPAQPGLTPAQILLHGYQRWGDDLPRHVIGDWAFALWDATRRRLLLARDPAGRRVLCFWHSGDQFRFASEPRALLAATDIPMQPDEQKVLEWLMMVRGQSINTIFRNIFIVRAGFVLAFERGRTTTWDYWQPEKVPVHRIAGPPAHAAREYAEGLLAVLQQAVRDRITGMEDGVGANLSGGLDSSTVAALAAEQLAPSGRTVTAFTAVPAAPIKEELFPYRFTDEGAHAAAVAQMYPNIRHVLIPNNSLPMFTALDAAAAAGFQPILNPCNIIWSSAIHQSARALGLKTVLGGAAGNMTSSWGGDGALSSLIHQRQYVQALKLARIYHRQGSRIRAVAYEAARPFLPNFLFHLFERRRGRSSPPSESTGLNLKYLQELGIGPDQYLRRWSLPDGNQMRILGMRRDDAGGRGYTQLRQHGLQSVDPTADQRVMEYVLSVPEQYFRFQGERRSLIKAAMADRLPQLLLTESRKGLQAADFFTHLSLEKEEVAAELNRMRQIPLLMKVIDFPTLDVLVANWPAQITSRDMHTDYVARLARSLSIGRFIRKIEDGTLYQ